MTGKHHEEEDADEEEAAGPDSTIMSYLGRQGSF